MVLLDEPSKVVLDLGNLIEGLLPKNSVIVRKLKKGFHLNKIRDTLLMVDP